MRFYPECLSICLLRLIKIISVIIIQLFSIKERITFETTTASKQHLLTFETYAGWLCHSGHPK